MCRSGRHAFGIVPAAAVAFAGLEQGRRRPELALCPIIALHALVDRRKTLLLRPPHRSALVTRKAVSEYVRDIDVARAQGNPFGENLRTLVRHRAEDASDDLFVARRVARDAQFLRRFLDETLHVGIGCGVASFVLVITAPSLLAETALLAEPIGDRRVAQVL